MPGVQSRMTDHLTKERRSWNMSRIRSTNTKPELIVRSILHRAGFRFRLHVKDLPGKPDIVMPKHKTVIFVHGCFWHGHKRCRRGNLPKSNQEYWLNKIGGNKTRHAKHARKLRRMGWRVIVAWECQAQRPEVLAERLIEKLAASAST